MSAKFKQGEKVFINLGRNHKWIDIIAHIRPYISETDGYSSFFYAMENHPPKTNWIWEEHIEKLTPLVEALYGN